MRRALLVCLALAGCAHVEPGDLLTGAGATVGSAAGAFLASWAVAPEPAPGVPVVVAPDGGSVVEWPDAGPCIAYGDRLCCTRAAIRRLSGEDGG